MYEPLLPFTPNAHFVVLMPLNIDGIDLPPGSPLPKSGLNDRLLRQLYEQRRIGVAGPDYTGLPPAAPVAPAPVQEAPSAPVATPAATSAPDAPTAPAYRVKQAGLGGFKVIDAKGQPIGKGWPTKAEAEAEIARLTAAKE